MFQASAYSVFYEFVAIGSKESAGEVILDLLSVLSDFGIFFIALVMVFNIVSLKGLFEKMATNSKPDEYNEEMWKDSLVNLVMAVSFIIVFVLIYFKQVILTGVCIGYMIILFFLFAINPILYSKKKKLVLCCYGKDGFFAVAGLNLFKMMMGIHDDEVDAIIQESNTTENKEGEEKEANISGTDKYKILEEVDKKRRDMYDIDLIEDDIANSFDSLKKIYQETNNTLSDEKEKENFTTFYKVLAYGHNLWDKAKDNYGSSIECCKCLKMARGCNMYGCNDYNKYSRCPDGMLSVFYKILISVLILVGQIIGIVNVCKSETANVFLYIFCRLIIIKSALDYNIFDSIINFDRTKRVIGGQKTIPLYIMFIFYFVGFILSIAIIIFTHTYDMPNVTNIVFEENNEKWIRDNRTQYNIPTFCSSTGMIDKMYDTADFAFMTTLPRLYEYKNNTCTVKPKLRGVFNNTMKYIFGKDYIEQGIKIYCYPYTHNPYLVITSDAMFKEVNATISNYSEYKYVYEEMNDTSKQYFDIGKLCEDKIAEPECNLLKTCISNDDPSKRKCEKEWDTYTNKYWEEYSSEDQGFDEFNNYEITIPSEADEEGLNETEKFAFRPRLVHIDNNETNITGQHFVVGGGFEDTWGYSYEAEIAARVYFPSLFGAIIPFYSIFETILPEFFRGNDRYNGEIFGITRKQELEYQNLLNLLLKFKLNFTDVYAIGHSVSAATMKSIAGTGSLPGIAFETKDTNTLALVEEKIIDTVGANRVNVYSDGMMFASYDDSYDVNGLLPEKFFNPNVYDTACLTTVVCSKTMKYVPLCNQVLTQHGEDSKENFQEILDAFYESRKQY
jgi:hypothetical protein